MNLIEQLSGYEKAKAIAEVKDSHYMGCKIEPCPELDIALLQHRREHGIYEVGDLVVYQRGETDGWVNKFSLFTVVSVIGDVLRIKDIDDRCSYLDIFEYSQLLKHATDAEIKAGHRL